MEDLTFEQAMAELEKITAELNSGGTALDETVALYEKGVELSDHCARLLKNYDGRIEQAMKKLNTENTEAEGENEK